MVPSYIVSASELVQSLLRCFEKRIHAYPDGLYSNREWTAAVRLALRGLGEERGQAVYCSDGKPGREEYLLDVMWFNPTTFRPDAVFESEWGAIKDILYDFEKLLYIKCSLKVLICDPQTRRDRLIPELVNVIKRYPDHVAGERYVVINLIGNPQGGETECYTWDVPGSGLVDAAIQFSRVAGSPFRYTLL